MEAGAAERAAHGQRLERVTDWPLMGASEYPLVVDLLTVARSRLHEVINDRMESLTELQTDFAGQ